MLRLLLDEHLSPTIGEQLSVHNSKITIYSLQDWQDGAYLQMPDEIILRAAATQNLTLVTFDQRTIAPLLKTWGEQKISHGGVIFINRRTFAANDFGGLVQALIQLWEAQGQLDWTNRIVYLTRPAT